MHQRQLRTSRARTYPFPRLGSMVRGAVYGLITIDPRWLSETMLTMGVYFMRRFLAAMVLNTCLFRLHPGTR